MLPSISETSWNEIQVHELASWTTKAWKTLQHKVEREREYQLAVLKKFRISGLVGIVADFGCGPSPVLEQIEGHFVGIGIDPLIPQYAQYHPVWESKRELPPEWHWSKTLPLACKAERVKLPDASVHHAISVNALDHFEDPAKAMDEMLRVLKPGGTIWLCVCIENATRGHPHLAHRMDLTPDEINDYLKGRIEFDRGEITAYGWRNQPSWLAVYRKN